MIMRLPGVPVPEKFPDLRETVFRLQKYQDLRGWVWRSLAVRQHPAPRSLTEN